MNVNVFKGCVLVVFSGLIILAGVLLAALQWGNTGNFSLYGKNIPDARMWLVMVCSAAGGILLVLMVRVLIRGIAALRRGRRDAAQAPSDPGQGKPSA